MEMNALNEMMSRIRKNITAEEDVDELGSYICLKPTAVRDDAVVIGIEMGIPRAMQEVIDGRKMDARMAEGMFECARVIAALGSLMNEHHEALMALIRQRMDEISDVDDAA